MQHGCLAQGVLAAGGCVQLWSHHVGSGES